MLPKAYLKAASLVGPVADFFGFYDVQASGMSFILSAWVLAATARSQRRRTTCASNAIHGAAYRPAIRLAHGIAHSALHTPTLQFLRSDFLFSSGVTAAKLGFMWLTCTSPALSIFSGARLTDGFDADYFGAQYLYKSGYDVDGYVCFVQRVWAAPPSANKKAVVALSPFPPASQRSKALRHEIAVILPARSEETISISAFDDFEEQLRFWQKQHPSPPAPTQPILRRADEHE